MIRNIMIPIVACCLVLICAGSSISQPGDEHPDWLLQRVSMDFRDEKLSVILGNLSKKTGVAILYDEKLVDEKFSGNYKDVKMVEFINRLFHKYNKAITYNREKKVVIVETFGSEKYIMATAEGKSSEEVLPFMDGMTKAELAELHREQNELYQESLKDKEETVPGLEISRGELEALQELQNQEYQADLNSPDSIIPGTEGKTRAELQKMQEQQLEEYRKSQEDPETIIPGMDMTQGELKKLHESQSQEYQQSLNNPDEIVPGLDMTRKELEELHKRQMEENK